MSKKRKRETTDVDLELVQLWDRLADNDEGVRLDAAEQLVSKSLDPHKATRARFQVIISSVFWSSRPQLKVAAVAKYGSPSFQQFALTLDRTSVITT